MIKNLINFNSIRYPVILEEIIYKKKNSEPIAVLRFKGELLPSKIKCSEIFNNNKSLRENIHPDNLLLLQRKYDEHCEYNFGVKVIEHLKDNKYKLKIQDFTITANGKDICNDINLLEKISMNEAYKIIYSTAYLSGYNDYKTAKSIKIKKENKLVRLKIISGNKE